MDRSFVESNRAATQRIRALSRLSDDELRTPVGQHWTVAIVLAHLAFWDRRAMLVLEKTEQDSKLYPHQGDTDANDFMLPLLQAIPPSEAARVALETAEALDLRLESFPAALLEEIYAYNPRWVERSRHRGEHLAEAEAALRSRR